MPPIDGTVLFWGRQKIRKPETEPPYPRNPLFTPCSLYSLLMAGAELFAVMHRLIECLNKSTVRFE